MPTSWSFGKLSPDCLSPKLPKSPVGTTRCFAFSTSSGSNPQTVLKPLSEAITFTSLFCSKYREMKPADVFLSFLPSPLPCLHLVHRCHKQDLGQRELADRVGDDLQHTGDLVIHDQGSAICVPTQVRLNCLGP